MNSLLVAVPVLPLLAIPLVLTVGRRLPWRGGEVVVGALALVLAALLLLQGRSGTLETTWFESGGYRLTVGLALDGLTWFGAVVVAGVSFCVAIYSLGYMADEEGRPRFFAELAFFVGAMLTLVLASSLVLLFAAWEMVGLASYLLIGLRFRDEGARAAAAKAFLMTRIGDFGFLLAWLLVLLALRTTDIAALLSAVSHGTVAPGLLTLVALLLFLAPVGKSAQLPLTAWLPDAMVAPTPVSALLHSATMVAAGIYLLLRLYPLFAAAPGALQAVFWVGAATAVFSAVVATGEMDLKRVLAWSTSSQLGEMMLAVGLGGPLAAALQFAMHAGFKSTLFLAAGVVDKSAGTRDLRRLHGLGHVLPVTALAFLVGAVSLAGLQPFARGSSDDVILATALASGPAAGILVIVLILLGGAYVGRAGSRVFLGSKPTAKVPREENRPSMLAGMAALAVVTALGSFILTGLPRLLPFGAAPDLPWAWRAGVLLAGAAGLGMGAWLGRTHARLARPALGRLPGALSSALAAATVLPGRAALWVARSGTRVEEGLDAAARWIADAVWGAALRSDRLERREFGGGGDRLAEGLRAAGGRLRQLETGKLYLYTLGVFVWSLAVLVAGGIALGF